MSIYFADKKWPEIEDAVKRGSVIILPVGMIEEHGHHLPLSTDTEIATAVAIRVAKNISDRIPVLVLPAIWTGYHNRPVSEWPGGIKLEPETLMHLVYDVCASLCKDGFKKIVLINGHGQNPAILEIVCRKIFDVYNVNPILTSVWKMIGKEGAKIRKSEIGGMAGHGDEVETALMLAINEGAVDMTKAVDESAANHNKFIAGDLFPEHDMVSGVYWSTWAVQESKTGILGDATSATKETGEKLLRLIVKNYEELIALYYNFGK